SNLLASRQFREAAEKPWIEARDIRVRALAELEGSSNPLVRVLYKYSLPGGSLPDAGDSFRECRAKLRLLRVAAHFRATGEVPDLDDPYGTKILSSRNGTHLKLWSVGADGIDDGGSGEWRPSKGKDIILEIER